VRHIFKTLLLISLSLYCFSSFAADTDFDATAEDTIVENAAHETVQRADTENTAHQSTTTMKNQLAATIKVAQSYQKIADSHLKALKNENRSLHEKVKDLQIQLHELSRQVQERETAITEPVTQVQQLLPQQSTISLTNQHRSTHAQHPFLLVELAGGLITVGLLMIFWLYWQQSKQQRQAPLPVFPETFDDDDEENSEYDFMNTEEALPAKLDLARAYIQMEDLDSAKSILHDILEHGDKPQQQEAQSLLDQIDPE